MCLIVPALAALVLLSSAGAAVAASEDIALRGCWRSQQVRVTLADGTHREQNGDCVIEYDGSRARSTCHGSNGKTETLSSYVPSGPGQLRVTTLDPVTGQPKGPASELNYRIEDEWLLFERQLPASAQASPTGKQPVSLKSVSIRVSSGTTKGTECRPRGENPLRVGRMPTSSLLLTLPTGWKPWNVDPATDKNLGPAVNSNFFVGAFVPQSANFGSSGPVQFVLVLDDTRYGPIPVRPAQFADVKKRFIGEMPGSRLSCDDQDRVCASLRTPNGATTYTELVNLNGRVAMVTAASQNDSIDTLRRYAARFVERLRLDNQR
ncbi:MULTISPECIES: hypothetical protein [unclassified Variovorax]|uniref:hypothetical protein n=1 Tax=unclassified Variovorax TaxID=663243 RepID=UPI00022A6858|nr:MULTISPECIES: hypothetical protein [unclassified Variovorax]AEO20117.1 hypothetical protein VASRS_41 [Variovorax sp. SRS16]VTV17383.1 hypothetical protein WDL1P1_00346 [Variovorax sp. WDL1]